MSFQFQAISIAGPTALLNKLVYLPDTLVCTKFAQTLKRLTLSAPAARDHCSEAMVRRS